MFWGFAIDTSYNYNALSAFGEKYRMQEQALMSEQKKIRQSLSVTYTQLGQTT
jgi:hypothetical protein